MSNSILPALPIVAVDPPMIRGTKEYEQKRTEVQQRFADSIPMELRLPQSVIDSAPANVTAIPRECGLLSEREIAITEDYDAVALADAIATKNYTAYEVATAFAKRAVIAHQLTACLTEWFMDEALDRAKDLDNHLELTGKTVGPLHGVPISIKSLLPLKGHLVDLGILSTQTTVDFDSHAVAVLRDAGAVFYCKTNQPQLIMHLESASFHGRTLNPYNSKLSSGGSSGGEAALLAMGGSILGIGSDIGGSIRGPAGFCGIYGFKPTSNVLPRKDGMIIGFAAEMTIPICIGPMSRSLRDMDLFMSVMSASRPWRVDPRLLPIPWTGISTHMERSGPLKVGIMMNDGAIQIQPPVAKALEWARNRLLDAPGIEVKSFEPLRTAEAMKNTRIAYWPSGAEDLRDMVVNTGEPWMELSEYIIKDAVENPARDADGMFKLRTTQESFWFDWAAHWKTQNVDILICPVFAGPAPSHGTTRYWNYTAFWNYLDMPGAVLPTPIVAGPKGMESYPDNEPLSKQCENMRQLWEDGDFEGAPIGIQVVAPRCHDNELFHALEQMKEYLQIK